ncbi:flagellar hook-basal body protein [Alicyclobacillus acidocaldarius]|uniref:Fagellar hook-basal body protein n=1 Tax=Alicyclobacillus acidocaldarius subsp. acidocaldarius (strain ATCC 27009 / DSM 446 / BCRC 14685 / JCM 5260 / KCTC 1825 / NBRC 15652 / NCIMB 11725 / NRRL B-14509 / 104-IA) TaxID=521098 RepID=C8WU09_ALIAD|nr:flagellar hook-basal body protein [Alicyclobacillus acidocaldarius]ACV59751.1 fagellar hook-basal body protein [Alicyclobacillus acidocaldarius subsp. acidocaldarius DSM 446]
MGQMMWNGLSGIQAANAWMDQIADNLANLQTPGYAAEQGTFADLLTMQVYGNATDPSSAARVTPPGWRGGTGVVRTGEERDFSQAAVVRTGIPTHLAIEGPGFFVVQTPSGRMYTRAGNFIWSRRSDGSFVLATQTGDPVLSAAGQPIVKPADAPSMTVAPDGTVQFGRGRTAKLALVEIGEPSSHLIPEGNGLYRLASGGVAVPARNSSVIQGAVNASNVDETAAMAQLVAAQDFYEENAQAISMANQLLGLADTIRTSGG